MKFRNIVIILTIILMTLLLFDFVNLGNFLIVNEHPIKSDVIIVLSGDNIPRTDYGVMLFKEGYSDKLLFTGSTPINNKISAAANMKQQAIDLGISQNDIIVEDKAISTYENAVFSKKLLIKYGYKSAIVVTSNWHMRRSSLVFNKAFKDTGISLHFCSSQDKNFTASEWWTNSDTTRIVFSEYTKLIGYFIKGRL